MECAAEQTELLLTQRPLLDSLLEIIISDDFNKAESACYQYCVTVDEYLELSALLDPILPTHTTKLCDILQTRLSSLISRHQSSSSTLETTSNLSTTSRSLNDILAIPSRALYTLCKVRGIKPSSAHFPHQVAHLRFLLPTLPFTIRKISPESTFPSPWQLRLVLFIWSSVAIQAPFPLTSIVPDIVISNAVDAARDALRETSRVADVAAIFLARLLARRDAGSFRQSIIKKSVEEAVEASEEHFRTSSFSLLAAVFKYAHRDDISKFIPTVLPILTGKNGVVEVPNSSMEAHRLAKLAHRVALAFLPPRPASWRYSRATTRMLSKSEKSKSVAGHVGIVGDDNIGDENKNDSNELSEENADRLETVIDLLFECLRHRDTVVRYSAAKGIARIAARLPHKLASDVADGLLELVSNQDESNAEASAHGGCLAIAELARRGLLLPSSSKECQLSRALNAIREAARFDIRKTAASVGSHVRDAACYAIWAVARAYDSKDVAPFGNVIANAMVPVVLLDREVNCRRAASGALQECVGRLEDSVFPEGIKLVTIADYFSIGDRTVAYLDICQKVARLGGGIYFDCIVHELWISKLQHWDLGIRRLAARAIAGLVQYDKKKVIIDEILPKMVPMATKRGDALCRHGAILGLSELIATIGDKDLKELGSEIRMIPMLLDENGYFNGRTGNDIMLASCLLIKSLAKNSPEVYTSDGAGRSDAEKSAHLLERFLGNGKEKMYEEATSAYAAMFSHVISLDNDWHVSVTRRVLDGLRNGNSSCELKRGCSLAIGSCGFSSMSQDVIDCLCDVVVTSPDVEVRRNAGISLANVPSNVVKMKWAGVLISLCNGMKDYTTDERGDVGSWVREACMSSFCTIVERLFVDSVDIEQKKEQVGSIDVVAGNGKCYGDSHNHGHEEIKGMTEGLMRGLEDVVFECCGRINRTRIVAGRSLKRICCIFSVKCRTEIKDMTSTCDEVMKIFRFRFPGIEKCKEEKEDGGGEEVSFENGDYSFPVMRRALHVRSIAPAVMRGFVAAGGGTRSQFRAPCEALVRFFLFDLRDDTETKAKQLQNAIMTPIYTRDTRLMIPALNVLGALVRQGGLYGVTDHVFIDIVKQIRASWKGRLRDVRVILAGIVAMEDLMALSVGEDGGGFVFGEGSVGKVGLEALMVVLGCGIPRLRGAAAEAIYTALVMADVDGYGQGCDKGVHKAMDGLLGMTWKVADIKAVRARRDEICEMLHVKAPSVVNSVANTSVATGNQTTATAFRV